MGRVKRILFVLLGSSMLLLMGVAMLAGALGVGGPIEATVVEAPVGVEPKGTYVEFTWNGEKEIKILDSDEELTIGSTIEVEEPEFKNSRSVNQYNRGANIGFIFAGVTVIAIAVGLTVVAFVFDPDAYRRKKILKSVKNLDSRPCMYWLFLHSRMLRSGVRISYYSFVMITGQEVVLGHMEDTTNVTETAFRELAKAGKLKPFVDNVRSRAIKSRYKKSFSDPFMAQSIYRIEITNNQVAIVAQDGVDRNFPVAGRTAREKYQVVQPVIDQLLPGVTPVVNTQETRFGKDKETLVVQR